MTSIRAALFLLIFAQSAFALQPDELLLIVNKNIPASVRSAEFYAKARLVPDGRIVGLNLPASEEITFDRYESEIVPTLRDFLRTNKLEDKVKCLVTFFGVPFRTTGRQPITPEIEEMKQIRQALTDLAQTMKPAVLDAEAFVREMDPQFVPGRGESPNELNDRAVRAMGEINRRLATLPAPEQDKAMPRIVKLARTFGGDAQLAGRLSDAQVAATLGTEVAKDWPARRKAIEAAEKEAQGYLDHRYDATARFKLRKLAADYFGAFGQIGILNGQLDYLQNDGTLASVDNELALLWWNYYSRAKYLPNPLHFSTIVQPTNVLMVCRIDGPQESTPAEIILGSLKAEKEGLSGRIVIDSTGGTGPGGVPDTQGGYRAFDRRLLNTADILRGHTTMPITIDRQPTVIPAGTLKDVAIYCGWYSVRNYVPGCKFVTGAVGYHVASFEMVSLRSDNEKGWVAGLLNDGVAATLGPVAEPYLAAFPPPDEFFPLLLTGKLTLAEVYWKTVPMTSWMMTCVGDPLYTPFKNNPQLKPEDLPPNLRRALATRP